MKNLLQKINLALLLAITPCTPTLQAAESSTRTTAALILSLCLTRASTAGDTPTDPQAPLDPALIHQISTHQDLRALTPAQTQRVTHFLQAERTRIARDLQYNPHTDQAPTWQANKQKLETILQALPKPKKKPKPKTGRPSKKPDPKARKSRTMTLDDLIARDQQQKEKDKKPPKPSRKPAQPRPKRKGTMTWDDLLEEVQHEKEEEEKERERQALKDQMKKYVVHSVLGQVAGAAGGALGGKVAEGLGFAAEGLGDTLLQAGGESVARKTTERAIENEGDMGKTLSDLGKSEHLCDMAKPVVAAGLMHGAEQAAGKLFPQAGESATPTTGRPSRRPSSTRPPHRGRPLGRKSTPSHPSFRKTLFKHGARNLGQAVINTGLDATKEAIVHAAGDQEVPKGQQKQTLGERMQRIGRSVPARILHASVGTFADTATEGLRRATTAPENPIRPESLSDQFKRQAKNKTGHFIIGAAGAAGHQAINQAHTRHELQHQHASGQITDAQYQQKLQQLEEQSSTRLGYAALSGGVGAVAGEAASELFHRPPKPKQKPKPKTSRPKPKRKPSGGKPPRKPHTPEQQLDTQRRAIRSAATKGKVVGLLAGTLAGGDPHSAAASAQTAIAGDFVPRENQKAYQAYQKAKKGEQRQAALARRRAQQARLTKAYQQADYTTLAALNAQGFLKTKNGQLHQCKTKEGTTLWILETHNDRSGEKLTGVFFTPEEAFASLKALNPDLADRVDTRSTTHQQETYQKKMQGLTRAQQEAFIQAALQTIDQKHQRSENRIRKSRLWHQFCALEKIAQEKKLCLHGDVLLLPKPQPTKSVILLEATTLPTYKNK